MDYYPQPRPVLYGTSADEPPTLTQTAPVRQGPPRWPPAPPLADFAPEPGDGRPKRYRWNPAIDQLDRPAAMTLLSTLYGLAVAFTCLQIAANASGLSASSAGFVALGIEIVLGLLAALSLWWPWGLGYLTALAPALLQVVLCILLGQWLWPLFLVAIASGIYLLLPSMRRSYGVQAVQTAKCDIARWKDKHPPRHGRHRGKPGNPPRNMPDHWRQPW